MNLISSADSEGDNDGLLSFLAAAVPQIKCLYTHGNPIHLETPKDVLEYFPGLVFLNTKPIKKVLGIGCGNIEDPCRKNLLTQRRISALQRMDNGSENYSSQYKETI